MFTIVCHKVNPQKFKVQAGIITEQVGNWTDLSIGYTPPYLGSGCPILSFGMIEVPLRCNTGALVLATDIREKEHEWVVPLEPPKSGEVIAK